MKVLLLTGAEIEELISMREAIEMVEEAFRAKCSGRVQMPPKTYIHFERYEGDVRVMPAYLEERDVAGVKIVNVHPRNPELGLPTVMALIVLTDPKTGTPLAVMDGTFITNLRTGAASAVAAKYLARKDSRVIAMIGAGAQARTQLIGLCEVLDIDDVRVKATMLERAREYANEMNKKLDLNVRAVESAEDAVRNADVIVTATPAKEPIVMNDWISEGVHINAVGADAPGKQELDPQILKRAKIVVDDLEQAILGGEINVPFSHGLVTRDDIYAELGEVVIGKKPGRISDREITVFDSTGLAVQDVATGWLVYSKALKQGIGKEVELL